MRMSTLVQYSPDLEMPRRHSCEIAFIPLVVTVCAFIVGVHDARAMSCQSPSSPTVTVEISKDDIQEAFDVTAADLKSAAAAIGAQTHQPALAAYSSVLIYAADISEDAQQETGEVYCATLASVNVEIALKNRVIHLARELQEDRCLQEAQLQHWREHACADAQAVEEFPFLSELRDAVEHLQPARARSALAAKDQVTTAIHSEIERLMDEVGEYRAAVKRKVDTPQAIEQLSAQMKNCPRSSQ